MKNELKNITAASHPKHYLLHRYWGRKAHNIVNIYIKKFTKKNDLVLDPFMGSGVVPIECSKIDRSCIGVDLNPISKFIVENSLNKINILDLSKEFNKIFTKNKKKFENLYLTSCPKCGSKSFFENSVWKNKQIFTIKGKCKNCGSFVKKADEFDVSLNKNIENDFKKKSSSLFYPKEQILKYVKRSDKTHIDMLFTKRAIIILSNLLNDINKIKDINLKNNLKLCFSSFLSSVSSMIPGDEKKVQGRSGWVVSKLWVPKIHTEKNIFNSLKFRFKKFLDGKVELMKISDLKNIKLFNQSSENLSFIKSNSVDYIFTDPPYGQSIAYFGLSMFWNSWMQNIVDYDKEIIYDPYRNKKYDDYEKRLINVFEEMYRVLKLNKYLSLTFNNRDIKIWEIVISNLKKIGFNLKSVIYQKQAVSSGTQGLNKKNTLKGDFVYNFQKLKKKSIKNSSPQNIEIKIIKKIKTDIHINKGLLTSDELYEKTIPYIVKNNFYKLRNGKPLDLESLLKKNFKYKKIKKKNITMYAWSN